MADVTFRRVEHPTVSVVMLTRDDIDWAPAALEALSAHTEPCYELIVVDNGSKDGTRQFLEESVDGITLLPNDRNYGFGVSNNLGASYAIGRYLLFLNSDVLVQRGWLPPLLAVLDGDEGVGAVGPRLLNRDGSMQLAGPLLSRAGATVSYGADHEPDRPEYSFPRAVDYCSGACLLVRRSAFGDVGGFDPIFGWVYFEDADLGLGLWAGGLRVVYEPRSTVFHVGGGGKPLRREVLLLAERNRAVFERRWRRVLAAYPFAPVETARSRVSARDARSTSRILVLGDVGCADTLARAFPLARVTLAAGKEEPDCPTVERLDEPQHALRDRRFHYDAIAGSERALGELADLIAETQPQAVQLRVEDLESDLVANAARAGIANV